MENSIYRFCLDIHKTTAQCNLDVKKGDTARELLITLTENGKPYLTGEDCRAVFTARKADGNYLYNECEIKDNTVKYVFTEQTAAAEGVMQCEIALYGADEALITSPRFDICVDSTVYNGEEIISSSEADALKEATEKAEAAAQSAEEKIKQLDVDLSGKQDKFGEVNFGVGTGIKLIGDSSYVIYRQKNGNPARVKGAAPTELDDFANKQYVDEELDGKVDEEDGKGLSSNDYTDEDKALLQSAVQPDTLNSALSSAVSPKADKAYTDDTFAPVINNTANGVNALRVDDVSDVGHSVDVKVKRANYFDISKVTSTNTLINNGDGTLTCKGYANASSSLKACCPDIEAGKTYTLQFNTDAANKFVYLATNPLTLWVYGRPLFVTENLLNVGIIWYGHNPPLNEDGSYNIISNIIINEGETALPYSLYVPDLSSVSISRYGKNLFDEDKVLPELTSEIYPTIHWDKQEDGSYYLFNLGTLQGSVWFKNSIGYTGRFSLSIDTMNKVELSNTSNALILEFYYTDGTHSSLYTKATNSEFKTYTYTTASGKILSHISQSYGNITAAYVKNISISYGTDADYTPYISPQTVQADENGNIEGLTSVSPDMTLMSDTDGVIIDCEYKADTKRYIDNQINNKFAELQAAVINAGGNI